MTPSLLTFTSVTFFLVITPGVTTTIVMQHAIRSGVRAGAAAAMGAACGNSTHAVVAALGVAYLVRRSPQLLILLGVGGGLYLCWLGLSSAIRAIRARRLLSVQDDREPRSALRDGLTVTLLNPYTVTFYLTVVPNFLPPDGGVGSFLTLGAIHVSMAFTCHLIWAAAIGRVRVALASIQSVRILDVAAGLALCALGLKLLYDQIY